MTTLDATKGLRSLAVDDLDGVIGITMSARS
jgi:hypothetical protein